MLSRRKFLKVFGFASLAFSLLPTVLVRRPFSETLKDVGAKFGVRNWLYGSPRRGCSTPDLTFEYHGKRVEGLKDFANIHIPPEFVSQNSHEQYPKDP